MRLLIEEMLYTSSEESLKKLQSERVSRVRIISTVEESLERYWTMKRTMSPIEILRTRHARLLSYN